mmetsp:Transcript_11582/g.13727  ORF Transcript_11582/g.13727 Transcript_11582/m.13727 type:complete len:304 (-) Transcript_11582:2205-3116(-)
MDPRSGRHLVGDAHAHSPRLTQPDVHIRGEKSVRRDLHVVALGKLGSVVTLEKQEARGRGADLDPHLHGHAGLGIKIQIRHSEGILRNSHQRGSVQLQRRSTCDRQTERGLLDRFPIKQHGYIVLPGNLRHVVNSVLTIPIRYDRRVGVVGAKERHLKELESVCTQLRASMRVHSLNGEGCGDAEGPSVGHPTHDVRGARVKNIGDNRGDPCRHRLLTPKQGSGVVAASGCGVREMVVTVVSVLTQVGLHRALLLDHRDAPWVPAHHAALHARGERSHGEDTHLGDGHPESIQTVDGVVVLVG